MASNLVHQVYDETMDVDTAEEDSLDGGSTPPASTNLIILGE